MRADRTTSAGQQALMLKGIVNRLDGELGDHFTRDTLAHYVEDSYRELAGRAKVLTHIPAFVERFAKQRLRALAQTGGLVTDHTPQVLFVCDRNDAASQMAAALFNDHAQGRALAHSAGQRPAAQVLDAAVLVMHELGIELAGEFPKPVTAEIEQAVDVIVALGPHDVVPVIDGKDFRAWRLEAAAGDTESACRLLRDELGMRVAQLVEEVAPPAPPPVRKAFDEDLAALDGSVAELGKLVLAMIRETSHALAAAEPPARRLAAADDEVDAALLRLEQQVADVIARRQPVAGDLRRVLAALMAGMHLERIADSAVCVADRLGDPAVRPGETHAATLAGMAELVSAMTEQAVRVLSERSSDLAHTVAAGDQELDELHARLFEELSATRPAVPEPSWPTAWLAPWSGRETMRWTSPRR